MKKNNVKNEKLIRTFIAFDIEESLRQEVIMLMDFLKQQKNADKVRWIPPENLHVTLRFLGEIAEEKIIELQREIAKKIKTINSFVIKTGKIIIFPPGSSHPRAIALTFSLTEELALLVQTIEDIVVQCGFRPENRPFLPHLTLGRISSQIELDFDNIKDKLREKALVKSVIFYQSELQNTGSVYTAIMELKLLPK